MEVKKEDLKKGKIKLIINLKPSEMQRYFKEAFNKIAPTIKLDGFRPGKAPRRLIESSAGITRILSDGLDLAISDSYFKAVSDNKLIPIGQPNIVINKYPHYGQTEEEIKDEFEYEAELSTLPPVTLADYSKIKIEKPKLDKAKKEDVEKVLLQIKRQNATLKDVDRPAKKGDRVEVTYDGFIKKVKIDKMCSKNHPIILGENTLIPGFEDELAGMKAGEEKEFNIKFPKDYHSKEFAGKEAEFRVKMESVKEIILPEENDDLAKKFGHDKIGQLKDAIEKNLNMEMEQASTRELENKIIEALLPLLKAEIPDILIEREVERMITDFASQITGNGLDFEKYLSGIKKTREELTAEMRPRAEKNVRIGLLLGKIVEENKWDQSDPQVGAKAMDYLVKKLTK